MPAAPFDPIAEAHRQWNARWPEQADHMAAVTSVMRVQQLLLSRIEDILKPYGLTFAAYEALRLLAFSRRGSLPMGKMGERLMVHPASVTNAISRLEQRGLVERRLSPTDRRVVLATITATGQSVVREATAALNQASFGLPGITPEQAAEITTALHTIRVAADDIPRRLRMTARPARSRQRETGNGLTAGNLAPCCGPQAVSPARRGARGSWVPRLECPGPAMRPGCPPTAPGRP